MEQPSTPATKVPLSHFPPFQENSGTNPVGSINRYLRRFLAKKQMGLNSVVFPSLSELAVFFHSSHMEVYDAFRLLRTEGFDYNFTGLDTPLCIWKQEHT